MGFFNNWPFSNLHNLNLDWIVMQIKKLTELTEQIWERVKPVPGGDTSTVTAAQAYGHATDALDTATQAGQSATTANDQIDAHIDDTNNPHNVTTEQIGAEPKISVLDVSHGGTGGYTPTLARANLGARADFTILPVSDGGTGSSTAAGARDALGVNLANIGAEPAFSVLNLDKGGTGATSKAGAQTALGILPYTRYQTTSGLVAGSGSSGAWITYQVEDADKCKLDIVDGAMLINRKRVLVDGAAVPFVGYDNGKIITGAGATNCWIQYYKGDTKVNELLLFSDGTASLNGKKILTES